MTDQEWLEAECYNNSIHITEAQEEAALEKIATLHADGWLLNNARKTGLSMAVDDEF